MLAVRLLPALLFTASVWAQDVESFPKTSKEASQRAAEITKRIEELESNRELRDLATLDEIRVLSSYADEFNRAGGLLVREDELAKRRVELPQRRAAAEAILRSDAPGQSPATLPTPTEAALAKLLGELEGRYARLVEIQSRIDDLDRLAEGASFLERENVRNAIESAERTKRDLLMGRSTLGPKSASIEGERTTLSIALGQRTLGFLDERDSLAPESQAVARLELDAARLEITRANAVYEALQVKFRETLTNEIAEAEGRRNAILARRSAAAGRPERALLDLDARAAEQTILTLQVRRDTIGRGIDHKLSGYTLEVRARLRSLDDLLHSRLDRPSGTQLADMYRVTQRFQKSKIVKDLIDELPQLRSIESKSGSRAALSRQRVEAFEEDEDLGRPEFARLFTNEAEPTRQALLTRYDVSAAHYLREARAYTYSLRSLSDAANARAKSIDRLAESLDTAERQLRSRALFSRVPSQLNLECIVRAAQDGINVFRDLPAVVGTLVSNAVNFVKRPGTVGQVLLAFVLLPLAFVLVLVTKRVAARISSSLQPDVEPSLLDRSKRLAASVAKSTALVGFLALAAVVAARMFEAPPALVRAVDASAVVVFFTRLALALATALLQPKNARLRLIRISDRAAKYGWRVAFLASLSIFAVAVPRQVLDAVGYGGKNHEFLEFLSSVQRGLIIVAVIILFARKSILDDLIPRGERPTWRIVRTAIVRLRPMILAFAIAIFVLPLMGFPFFGSFLESIAVGGVIIAAGATFAHRAVMELWYQYSPRLTLGHAGSHEAQARRELLNQVVHWVSLTVFLGGAYFAFVAILRVGEDELSAVDIGVVAGRRLSVLDILRAMAVFAGGLVLANWARRSLDLFFLPLTKLDVGTRYAVAVTTSYVVILIGLAAACLQLGLQFGDFTILLGAAGFAIGLGMQQAAANFLSGLVLLFSRPVKVGDVIESESRIGTVTDINIASTVIVTPENHEIRIPNGDIIGKRLVNQSGHDPKVRAICRFGVAYATNLDTARTVMLDAVKRVRGVYPSPPAQVVVGGFGDSAVQLELWFWASVDIYERERVTSEVRSTVMAALSGAGIDIPFAQTELRVKGPIEIRKA